MDTRFHFVTLTLMLADFMGDGSYGYNGEIPLGAIFDYRDAESRWAFDFAYDRHKRSSRTPSFVFNFTKDIIDITDNFQLANAICRQMAHGVFAILGQKAVQSSEIVRSLTSTFHMPYVTPSLSVVPRLDDRASYELHLRPDHTAAMVDVIEVLGWKHVHFLYDSDEGLQRLQHIHRRMRNDSVQWFSMLRFNDVQRVHDDLRMADAADNNTLMTKAFVLDLSSEEAYATVLKQIPEVGMNKFGYSYLLGTMDYKALNLSRFYHGGVNVTGFQLLDGHSPVRHELTRKIWNRQKHGRGHRSSIPNRILYPSEDGTTHTHYFTIIIRYLTEEIPGERLPLDVIPEVPVEVHAVLTVDGMSVMESAVSGLLLDNKEDLRWIFRRNEVYNLNRTKGIPCTTKPPLAWMLGEELLNQTRRRSSSGLSGNLSFGDEGARKNYSLGVYSIALDKGQKRVGTWSPGRRFVGIHEVQAEDHQGIERPRDENATKVVISILSDPCLMMAVRKNGEPEPVGNDRFEGFCLDLARKLAEEVGFSFEFKLVSDGNYGVLLNGTWNGVIGDLLSGRGDMAIAPLTISADRERYVDFSKEFMQVGVTIMIKKPQRVRPGVFSFFQPLSIEVWFCIIVAYVTVSVSLFLVSRFSPLEWKKSQEGDKEEYTNDFSLFNCFWFSMGALMFQGSDTCPRSASGRIIGGAWWFFVLIIISSYTANLAAFLTIERMIAPIESADDLVNHPTIKYGAVKSGTTLQFFLNSEVPVYRQMGEYMRAHDELLVDSNEEGFARVLSSKGKYAFLAESSSVEYANNRLPCASTTVDGHLNEKGFGVATPRNSKLRNEINVAVLKLKEKGTLHTLKQKWWVEKGQCGGAAAGNKKGKLSLTLTNVAGIFYILIIGLVMSIILGVFQFTCFRRKHKTEDTVTGDCYLKATNTQTTLCAPPDREERLLNDNMNPGNRPPYIGFEKLQTEFNNKVDTTNKT